MFEKSVIDDLLKIKESSQKEYISFFNDGTNTQDSGERVLTSSNERLNEVCSGIDNFLKDGTKAMSLIATDYDELNFIFKMGIIYGKNTLGENNEILPTSQCLNGRVRYYTESVEAYKDGKLVKEIPSGEIMGHQGFVNYDELIKSAKKEKIAVLGPTSFEELKAMIINGKNEKISFSINFTNIKEKDIKGEPQKEISPLVNEEVYNSKQKDTKKIKKLSLFRR